MSVSLTPPASPVVTASPNNICAGGSSALVATTSVGTINWWDSQTGGNFLGSSISGNAFIVSPTAATTYWAEVTASCGTSSRVSVSVVIGGLATAVSVNASPSILSCGGSSSLSAVTIGQNIAWYDSPTGGNLLGNSASGANFAVSPVGPTTYYAEAQNTSSGTVTFSYTGAQQTFSVPAGVFSINVDVYGAQGGTYATTYNSFGGLGGRMKATMSVTPSQLLYLYVGQAGSWNTVSPYGAGWNGGGAGGYSTYQGGGGGGASDIRIGSNALANRVIVAGGGGGASYYPSTSYANDNGGVGGDYVGGYGLGYGGGYYTAYSGAGGSQTAGGIAGASGGTAGSLGTGGAAYATYGGGGGGGGYYGGGGGYYYGAGGGGSNFIATTGFSNIVRYQGVNTGNGQIIISYFGVTCTSSIRASVTVSVTSSLVAPTPVTSNPSTLTCGSSTTLNATSSSTIGWYNGANNSNRLGTTASGGNFVVVPSTTMNYYAESESVLSGTLTFAYSGAAQSWIVPNGTTSIDVDAYGAAGMSTSYGASGLGGRVQATLSVTPGQTLYFYVGQAGPLTSSSTVTPAFNGGGLGGWSSYQSGGGGASDIRTASGSFWSRLLVAGGGGGAAGYSGYTPLSGGAGGGLVGGDGGYGNSSYAAYRGGGGTQTAGGAGGYLYGGPGIFGVGGYAYYVSGGGGGGGYYGGGAAYYYAGGGGGSSWTSPSLCSNVVHTQGYSVATGNGRIVISYNSVVCASARTPVAVTVNGPTAPVLVASPALLCTGQSAYLTGTTSTGVIRWWDAASGGNLLGSSMSGANFTVSPTATTIYYGEINASCGISTRVGDTVNVGTLLAPTAFATPSTISCGGSSSLSGVTNGQLIGWYSASTGGTLLGQSISGGNFVTYPTTATTYYAEAQNNAVGAVTFSYTGAQQTFTVPTGVTSLGFDVYGAQGGTYRPYISAASGPPRAAAPWAAWSRAIWAALVVDETSTSSASGKFF